MTGVGNIRFPYLGKFGFLLTIGALYAIERIIRGQLPTVRARVRQERAGPLLDALYAWLAATLQSVSAKSELAGAIRYALVRWPALTRYRDDGRIEIGRVEKWRGGLGGAYLLPALSFAGASLAQPCSVSTSRSSNRTCRFPASGSLSGLQTFAFGMAARPGNKRISPRVS